MKVNLKAYMKTRQAGRSQEEVQGDLARAALQRAIAQINEMGAHLARRMDGLEGNVEGMVRMIRAVSLEGKADRIERDIDRLREALFARKELFATKLDEIRAQAKIIREELEFQQKLLEELKAKRDVAGTEERGLASCAARHIEGRQGAHHGSRPAGRDPTPADQRGVRWPT